MRLILRHDSCMKYIQVWYVTVRDHVWADARPGVKSLNLEITIKELTINTRNGNVRCQCNTNMMDTRTLL